MRTGCFAIPTGPDSMAGRGPGAPPAGRRRWRHWLTGLVVAGALVAAILHFGELRRFAALVRQAEPLWLLAAAGLQAATYAFVAQGWRLVLRRAGSDPPLGVLVRIAVTKLFADQAVPSGGMSGNILLVDQLIARGVPRGVASAALIVSIVGYYAAFAACALAALALLWLRDEASLALAIVLTVFLVFAAGIPALALWLGRGGGGRVAARVRRIGWLSRLFETIAAAPPVLLRDGALVLRVGLWNLGVFLADAATLWVCFRALGVSAAFWQAFVALVMASIVTTLGPIPMGLGSFEATATGTLHLVGVQAEAAFAATLLLRLFTLWAPLLPGLWLIRRISAPKEPRGGG